MIRCPGCNTQLNELQYELVRCPNCEMVINTNQVAGYQSQQYPQQDPQHYPQHYPQQGGQTNAQQPPPPPPPSPQYQTGPPYQSPPNAPSPYAGYSQVPPSPNQQMYIPAPAYAPGQRAIRRVQRISVGETLSGSMKLYREHLGTYVRFWTLPAVLSIILGILIETTISGINITGGDETPYLLAAIIPLILVIMIIYIVFSGGVIAMTFEAMRYGRPTTRTGHRAVRIRGIRMVITSVIVAIVLTFSTAICFLAGALFCYWYFFAVTVVTLEGRSIMDSLEQSKKFSEQQEALPFVSVIIFITVFILILGGLAASMLSVTAGSLHFVGTLISGIISWLFVPYIYVATAYFYIRGNDLNERAILHIPEFFDSPPSQGPGGPLRPEDY